jgi:hypothetical protein
MSIGGGGLKLIGALAGAAAVSGGKSNLSLSQPRVEVDCGPEVTFQLSGGVNFTVSGTPVTATARLVINETEAQVAVEISGQQKPLPPPPGIKGLNIESFGVVMGVYFAPPGLDLGLTGKFTIGNIQNLKGDSFGIVLEVLEEAANVLYLAFSVDQLDLGQVLSLFTDRSEPALVQSLDFIKASDLAFHWCDSVVTLPDGSIVPPGFGFSASLDVLGFGAHADLEVGITDGIHGHAEIAPFSLNGVPKVAGNGTIGNAAAAMQSNVLDAFAAAGIHGSGGLAVPSNAPAVLTVTGDGKGMTRTYEEINGTWQQVDNAAVKRTLPAPPTRTQTIVAAGGPVLQFNCKQAPFIQAGLTVSLFEAHAAVSAHVDQTGFGFGLDFDVGTIDKFTLNCTLQDKDHFAASSAVKIGIDAQVGPVHVNGHDCGRLHLVTRGRRQPRRHPRSLAVQPDARRQIRLPGSYVLDAASRPRRDAGKARYPAAEAHRPVVSRGRSDLPSVVRRRNQMGQTGQGRLRHRRGRRRNHVEGRLWHDRRSGQAGDADRGLRRRHRSQGGQGRVRDGRERARQCGAHDRSGPERCRAGYQK